VALAGGATDGNPAPPVTINLIRPSGSGDIAYLSAIPIRRAPGQRANEITRETGNNDAQSTFTSEHFCK
jgi:hypothetical protein